VAIVPSIEEEEDWDAEPRGSAPPASAGAASRG
jgi:hypothetical protein